MSHTPDRSPHSSPNPDAYSDTEERDNGMSFLHTHANRSFPQDRYPDGTVDGDHFSNTTFPGGRRGPRDLRRTNAFHSHVARSIRDFDHPDDHVDENITSQETDNGPVPHRNTARWERGRLPDHTSIAQQPVRESSRYHPYDMEADRTPTTTRMRGQSRSLSKRHRYQPRESSSRNRCRSSNSTEERDETPYDRDGRHEHASPKKASHHPIQDRQAIDAMLQHYIKSLSEQERMAFYQGLTSGVNKPVAGLTLEAEPAAANSIDAPTETVVGLLPAPAVHHLDDSDVLAEAEVDFERINDVLKQLTRVVDDSKVRQDDETSAVMGWFQPLLDKLNGSMINAHLNTWHDSETVLHEALLNLTTKALAKAVELKEKAVVELDKIDAAEKEKLRLIEIAREDFKNILSGQQAELGLLDAGFEEKTKALRNKAEKLLTTDEISAEALANVNRRQSTKIKARR